MIKSLSITNFMQIEKLELELAAPLNFIAGQNEAGKSSIRDALLWGFCGQARGLKTQQEQAAMIREGANVTEVSIFMTNGHAFTRRKTLKTSAQVLGDVPDIGLAPAILMDPFTFLSWPEAQRRELLFKVIPGLAPTEDNILSRICRWPAVEAIQTDDENTQPLATSPLGIIKSVSKMAVSHGFPGAEKECVTKRREAKRLRDEFKGAVEPEKIIVIDGKEYDIPTLNLPAIEATLKDLQKEKDGLLRQKGAGEARAKRLATVKGQLEKIGTLPPPPPDNFIQQLQQDLAGNKCALEINTEEMQQAMVQEQFFPATCPVITLESMACPKAGGRVGSAPVDPGVIESLKANRQGLIKAGDEITIKLAEANKQVTEYQTATARKASLEEELVKLATEPDAGADLDVEIATRQNRINRGSAFERAAYDYDIALGIYKGQMEKLAAAEQEVIIYDALQKALAPDGIPSQMIAEALDGVNDLLDEAATYLFPGRYLHLTGDLSIVLQNSPYVTLSKSAKYRVGVAFQYALSRLVGARILLIDEADILDTEHFEAFYNFLLAHLENFDQIMVFMTADCIYDVFGDPRAQAWWLADGKLTQVAA
ncbi:MAG: AAA family ATPase [Candidatus Micrarchaeia archaeon]|jgi:DNA repair exonuclease SbcCD ATPase subunit